MASGPESSFAGNCDKCDSVRRTHQPSRQFRRGVLVAGGVFYSAGIVFHLARVRFQDAIWHSFFLAAAACHYAAIVHIGA